MFKEEDVISINNTEIGRVVQVRSRKRQSDRRSKKKSKIITDGKSYIFEKKYIPVHLKAKVFDSFIVPVITYGA